MRGHIALGLREENQFLRFRASLSPDSLIEFSLWKLFRFDIGLVGAGVGVGPIDVALGTLFYDPYIPRMMEWGEGEEGLGFEEEARSGEDSACEGPMENQPSNEDNPYDADGGEEGSNHSEDSSWLDRQGASGG